MSQVVKRVCDLCGHEITENLDTGNINFNYANSMGYMCSHNIDICKECAPKIVPALHKTLTDLFKLKENDIVTLGYVYNNWGSIYVNGKCGFVNVKYLKII